ncbi:hypothetical protein MARSALSMR5_04347 (plasmid) [Marinobacter salarius]|uniref:Uncharacterized protein n=1 Tax=Marinobacter salarius TaxID=1420917 RepID=A0A1W6KG19_9GAMM|nr:hypothetical protein MARSALSMR5_04347 [Marinobacter salarius]
MKWLLILTLEHYIHTVPDFTKEVACENAGKKWESRVDSHHREWASWTCVQRQNPESDATN